MVSDVVYEVSLVEIVPFHPLPDGDPDQPRAIGYLQFEIHYGKIILPCGFVHLSWDKEVKRCLQLVKDSVANQAAFTYWPKTNSYGEVESLVIRGIHKPSVLQPDSGLEDELDQIGTNYLSVRGFVQRVGRRSDGNRWAQIKVGTSPTGEDYLLGVDFEEVNGFLNEGDFVESFDAHLKQKRILCPRLIPRGKRT